MQLVLDNSFLRLYIFNGNVPVVSDAVLFEPLDDGGWYKISVQFYNKSVTVIVQGSEERCNTDCKLTMSYPSNFEHFASPFTAQVVFGDFASYLNYSQQMLNNFPTNVGIISCIRNFRLSNTTIQNLQEGISELYPTEPGCPREDVCYPNPCGNGGSCIAGWDSYSCQCMSSYTGSNCTEGMNAL